MLNDEDTSLDDINDEEESFSMQVNADGTPSLIIETQPPIEVRTRTPSEKRFAHAIFFFLKNNFNRLSLTRLLEILVVLY